MVDTPNDDPPALRELLLAVVPRERSGARMTNRVEYQKHWALSEMLERHRDPSNYCFVFEFHDDVAVLDDADQPTTIAFYQIKTKSRGEWKLTELLKRDRPDDDSNLSIIGKMYVNRMNFPQHATSLTFVSNVPCSAKLEGGTGIAGDRDLVSVMELDQAERDAVLGQLRAEHGAAVADGDASLIFLAHSSLALRDTEAHGVGKLDAFLRFLFPARKLPVHSIYRALLGEISRRSGHEDVPGTFAELIRERGFSRSQVEDCLRAAGVYGDPDEAWRVVESHLRRDTGWGPRRFLAVRAAWRRYEVERMNPENIVLQRLTDAVRMEVARLADEDDVALLLAMVATRLDRHSRPEVELMGDDYLHAMILFEFMEYNADHNISSPGSTTSEEAP